MITRNRCPIANRRAVAPRAARLGTFLALLLSVGACTWAQESRPTSQPAGKPTSKPATTQPKPDGGQAKPPTTKPTSRPAGQPGGGAPPAPKNESTPEGKELLAEMLEAMGGAEKFAQLKNLTWTGGMIRAGQGVEIDVNGTVALPNGGFKQTLATLQSSSTFAVLPDSGWENSSTRGFRTLDAAFVKNFRNSLSIATTPLLANWKSLIVQARAPEVVAGMDYDVLRCWRGDSNPVDFLLNPETRMIEYKRTRIVGNNGAMILREEKTWDYRSIDGLQFPFHKRVSDNGAQRQVMNMTGYQINRDLPADFFDPPKQ